MRTKISLLVIAVCLLFFLLPVSFINASYQKYTGTYKGTWRSYDMTCPNVYSNTTGKITLRIIMKAKYKFTGKLKFGTGEYYKMTGTIKNKKIKLHYKFDKEHLYDYNGTIKRKKITMNAFNNDALAKRKCLTGWNQEIKAKKK